MIELVLKGGLNSASGPFWKKRSRGLDRIYLGQQPAIQLYNFGASVYLKKAYIRIYCFVGATLRRVLGGRVNPVLLLLLLLFLL